MIKKISVFIFSVFLFSGCHHEYREIVVPEERISAEEAAFNASGQAKAVENETDLWQFYEDQKTGFTLNYPHDVVLSERKNDDGFQLFIRSEKIDGLEGTMGYGQETAEQNVIKLASGDYGQEVDFPLPESKKIRKIGDKNAQEFMVLTRFEICDVALERKLYFFNNDHQIVITLSAPKNSVLDEIDDYLTTNEENCGDQKIWDFEKQKLFYEDLVNGKGGEKIQHWFDTFDKIAKTIELSAGEKETTYQSLQGKWKSIDDEKSVIQFSGKKQIGIYDGKEVMTGSFKLYETSPVGEEDRENKNGKYLVVHDQEDLFHYRILELTEKKLTLSYSPRGNTLRYERE